MNAIKCMRLGKTAACALTAVLLAACTSMADLPAGTPLHQITSEYGEPDFSCPAPDGGERLIWTMQPMGQYAWGTTVDAAGNTDRVQQLLNDEHFRVLASGSWTPEQVRCEFGPPAEIDSVGLPSSTSIVWSYRYRQAGAWNSLMYVYFGSDGSRVTRFHPGPDPLYERNVWFD